MFANCGRNLEETQSSVIQRFHTCAGTDAWRTSSLGIFQAQYQADNLSSYSPSTISWIFTFQLFLIFFMSQINGILIDMYGPRAVSIPAAILEVVGLATLGSCTKYYQYFLAQGVAFGIGAAGLFVPGKRSCSWERTQAARRFVRC